MSYAQIAALGEIVLAIGYAVAVLIVIAVVCVVIAKLFGKRPRRESLRHGGGRSGEDEIYPGDGTPH